MSIFHCKARSSLGEMASCRSSGLQKRTRAVSPSAAFEDRCHFWVVELSMWAVVGPENCSMSGVCFRDMDSPDF